MIMNRLSFFFVITISVIFQLIAKLILGYLAQLLNISGLIFINWGILLISTIIGICFGIIADRFLISHDVSPKPSFPEFFRHQFHTEVLSGFTFRNWFSQLRAMAILICIIYIPLDFFSYAIPPLFGLNILEYSSQSLLESSYNTYLLWDLPLMVFSALFVHFMVAVREEIFFRHYLIGFGKPHLTPPTAFLYSAFIFGLAHLSYLFLPTNQDFSILYPFWWALNATFIGLVSGFYFRKTGYILPIIGAHWVNNVISSLVIRQYMDGLSFWDVSFLYCYMPIIIIGCILFVFNFQRIKNYIIKFFEDLRKYWLSLSSKWLVLIDLGFVTVLWFISANL